MVNQIICADATEGLRGIESGSVDMCVTSPPYFRLRCYNIEGQIGMEDTPEAYISRLVDVFREVRRVLRDDGTLWVVIGDSYNGSGKAGNNPEYQRKHTTFGKPGNPVTYGKPTRIPTLKPKDLIGIPWMLAFALRDDGWYLRSDSIWSKVNPLPSSVKDRPTTAHEYIFLLSKSRKYYYDYEAIKEPCSDASVKDFLARKTLDNKGKGEGTYGSIRPDLSRTRADYMPSDFKRNKRSVWTVATKPYKGAHFATFPPELIRPCILAGSRAGGIVLDPFFGAGTTGLVAMEEQRGYIGIELNPEYAALAQERLDATGR